MNRIFALAAIGIAVVAGVLAPSGVAGAATPEPAGNAATVSVQAALARNAARAGVPVIELRAAYACFADATSRERTSPEDLVDIAASVELTAGANRARRAAAVKSMCDLLRASSL
ncbi:MAG TPA: hypothetical protein VME41_11590 [Stellaceae bacterium]|nr:hypothetical protein [Stellaceae bacterium]